jgi:glycosyltransferase involved in cell wall biosynthesis
MILNSSLISVVMPVYNAENYLREAIESILNQTYTNYEFIIINDGSTDKSLNIIKEYKSKDNRIILINNNQNQGIVSALNYGIKYVKGKYIARMDSDDISLPYRLEKEYNYIIKNDLDLCGSFAFAFRNKIKNNKLIKVPIEANDIKYSLLFSNVFLHPTIVFNKYIFKDLKYETEVAQDYDLWCKIVLKKYRIGNIPEPLLYYRFHKNQITFKKSKKVLKLTNEIALNYANELGVKELQLVKDVINSKENINFTDFKLLINRIKQFAKEVKLSSNALNNIIKVVYINSTPKSPLKYLIYFKNLKTYNFYEELKLFLNSFIFFKRSSSAYQFLKRIKNYVR